MSAQADAGPAEDLLARFAGDWEASEVGMSGATGAAMTWAPLLGGKFSRVDYRIEFADSNFTGQGYYRAAQGGTLEGFWVDSNGDLHPLHATVEDMAVRTNWGRVGGRQGRTEYRLMDDDRMQVRDWMLTDAGWRPFNSSMFERVAAD
jgi:hypothetical protein